MDVSVIIVNYNTADLISTCLNSLLEQQDSNFEIMVVDNHSQDESVDVLANYKDQITLLANNENYGFGYANNQAAKICNGEYLFFLNPDAVLKSKYDLKNLYHFFKNSKFGLVGTRIVNAHAQLEKTAFDHYPHQDQVKFDFSYLPGKIATVLGASMFMSSALFHALNGFDEDFFLYAEETDLCLRVRKAGYEIGYCDIVTVQHIGSASERKNSPLEIMQKKKLAKYLFYRKHYPLADVKRLLKRDLWHARKKGWWLKLLKLISGLNYRQKLELQKQVIFAELVKQQQLI